MDFAPEASDVHFGPFREAGQTSAADRNRRSPTAVAVDRGYSRPLSVLLGDSDLNRCGAARDVVADRAAGSAAPPRGCLGRLHIRSTPLPDNPARGSDSI